MPNASSSSMSPQKTGSPVLTQMLGYVVLAHISRYAVETKLSFFISDKISCKKLQIQISFYEFFIFRLFNWNSRRISKREEQTEGRIINAGPQKNLLISLSLLDPLTIRAV